MLSIILSLDTHVRGTIYLYFFYIGIVYIDNEGHHIIITYLHSMSVRSNPQEASFFS
jgi:hypothetical protein